MDERDDIVAWKRRWRIVNAVTATEHREGGPIVRLRILDALYASYRGSGEQRRSSEEPVWRQMQRLRESYGVTGPT